MNLTKAHIKNDHYKTQLEAGNNTLIADEPVDVGGMNLGFSPGELLLSSLGACTSITLRMYADRKGWPLEEVKCELAYEQDTEKKTTHIVRSIELIGALSEEEKKRLLMIADRCPTHLILTNPVTIETISKH